MKKALSAARSFSRNESEENEALWAAEYALRFEAAKAARRRASIVVVRGGGGGGFWSWSLERGEIFLEMSGVTSSWSKRVNTFLHILFTDPGGNFFVNVELLFTQIKTLALHS